MSAILHVSGPETTQAPTVTRFGYQAEIQIIFGTVYKKRCRVGDGIYYLWKVFLIKTQFPFDVEFNFSN